ncbi:hypothetical protein GJ496_008935 [Pomphorhynchus laevis]|nr:hypothetical protein GJ496_008935 [Pomphorhynchus laevis]
MDDAYREVIIWKPNLCSLPKCNTSNDFVKTLAGLYSIASSNREITKSILKSIVVFCQVVFQATGKSKTRVIRTNISRRMTMWKSGKLFDLMNESRILQSGRLFGNAVHNSPSWVKKVCQLVSYKKTSTAMQPLDNPTSQRCVLGVEDRFGGVSVGESLIRLHPHLKRNMLAGVMEGAS